jgi:hypothetical protein
MRMKTLWTKTWCETRVRLAIAVATLTGICVAVIGFHGDVPVGAFPAYVWSAAYNDSVKTLFILLTILLAGGSLRQERALGTLGFTLALPVSRSRLFAARAAVGLSEVLALAALVAILVPGLSRLTGHVYPMAQAIRFGVLWAVCGAVTFAMALLFSVLITSEIIAWLAAFLVVMGYEALVNLTALRRQPLYDLYRVMSGNGQTYLDDRTGLIVGALPWVRLALIGGAGAVILVAASLLTRRVKL